MLCYNDIYNISNIYSNVNKRILKNINSNNQKKLRIKKNPYSSLLTRVVSLPPSGSCRRSHPAGRPRGRLLRVCTAQLLSRLGQASSRRGRGHRNAPSRRSRGSSPLLPGRRILRNHPSHNRHAHLSAHQGELLAAVTFCYYLLSVCRFHCFFRYACCSSFSFVFMILEISLLSFSLFVYLPVIPIICLFISLSIYGSYLHHILIFALLYFCPLSFSVVSNNLYGIHDYHLSIIRFHQLSLILYRHFSIIHYHNLSMYPLSSPLANVLITDVISPFHFFKTFPSIMTLTPLLKIVKGI